MNIKSALVKASALFTDSDSSSLDAELLLAFVLDKPREYLFTWPEKEVSIEQLTYYNELCSQRNEGHPIAYLIGQRSFWDFELLVNEQVLIPRPDTELVVELCLKQLNSDKKLIVDLGTGSGAIALALASERPQWQVLACDISPEALKVAEANREALALQNVNCKQGVWCEAFTENGVDAIISNPPYIDVDDEHLAQGDVRFEPKLALVSEDNGLADIKIISKQAKQKLKVGGYLLFEHGYQQGEAVRKIMLNHSYAGIETYQDLSGNDRVTCGQLTE